MTGAPLPVTSYPSSISSMSIVRDYISQLSQQYMQGDDINDDAGPLDEVGTSHKSEATSDDISSRIRIRSIGHNGGSDHDEHDEHNHHRGVPEGVRRQHVELTLNSENENQNIDEEEEGEASIPFPFNFCQAGSSEFQKQPQCCVVTDDNDQFIDSQINSTPVRDDVESNGSDQLRIGVHEPRCDLEVTFGETIHEEEDDTCSTDTHIVWETVNYFRYMNCKKRAIGLSFLTMSLYVMMDVIFFNQLKGLLFSFLQWMNANSILGLLTFTLIFVFTTLTFMPVSIMIFGAGFVFTDVYGLAAGIVIATVVSFVCSCIGATFAFLQSKYMTRDLARIYIKKYPYIKAADKAVKKEGFRIMILLRLSPFIPFTAVNYIGGLTGLRFCTFLKSLVGILPLLITTVCMGATASTAIMPAISFAIIGHGSTSTINNPVLNNTSTLPYDDMTDEGISISRDGTYNMNMMHVVSLVITIALGMCAILILWYFARRELERALDEAGPDDDDTAKNSLSTITSKASKSTTSTKSSKSSEEEDEADLR